MTVTATTAAIGTVTTGTTTTAATGTATTGATIIGGTGTATNSAIAATVRAAGTATGATTGAMPGAARAKCIPAIKIGSGSFRERVCRSGVIRVVAGSLKKN